MKDTHCRVVLLAAFTHFPGFIRYTSENGRTRLGRPFGFGSRINGGRISVALIRSARRLRVSC